ncbi:peptidase C14, caspase domain-containing protein [Melanogaster broomeanus]|nr:peptidase C14, caspase domain-containing protein [Melanogaster broomeanus]
MAQINQASGGIKKALLIAVRDVKIRGFPILHNAHHNAEDLQRLLIDVFGYPEDKVIVMMDKSDVTKDLWPTRANIKKQIWLFVRGASPGDHLFFYYSGHGHQVTCNHHSETDGLDEIIFTGNGKQIPDNDLKKWLVNPLPRGCKFFALWDSCHSKTILDLDHHNCNEPDGEQCPRQHRESDTHAAFMREFSRASQAIHRQVFLPLRLASTTATPKKHRGRPATRASLTLTAVSPDNSPRRSHFFPFSDTSPLRRFLSPPSWFKCDGTCKQPVEKDRDRAHVISLSACKDNEMAFDDNLRKGTVTKACFLISNQVRAVANLR